MEFKNYLLGGVRLVSRKGKAAPEPKLKDPNLASHGILAHYALPLSQKLIGQILLLKRMSQPRQDFSAVSFIFIMYVVVLVLRLFVLNRMPVEEAHTTAANSPTYV